MTIENVIYQDLDHIDDMEMSLIAQQLNAIEPGVGQDVSGVSFQSFDVTAVSFLPVWGLAAMLLLLMVVAVSLSPPQQILSLAAFKKKR